MQRPHLAPRRARAAAALSTAALAALAAVACNDRGPTTPAGTGSLAVALTDAPFPFDSVARVDLHVVRVEGKLAEADVAEAERGTETENRNEDPRGGWVTLAAPNAAVDFLALQNGKTLNLGLKTLPTGTYRGFRLVLDTDRSSVTLKDGTVLTGTSSPGIRFPSAGRTGIKVQLAQPIAVTENGTQMVVDFDLGKSFVLRGRSLGQGGLLFKPVVRGSAADVTGSLVGTVVADSAAGAPLPGATVEILRAGTALTDTVSANVVATTKADSAGAFTAAFLMPGSYAVRATQTVNGATKTGLVEAAAVSRGARTVGVTVVAR